MDDEGAVLGVGFTIDFHDSFGQLRTFEDIAGETAANIARHFEKIEGAAKRSGNLGGAAENLKVWSSAATRELNNLRLAKAQNEKQSEALVRQLEREAQAIGRTRDEMQAAKAQALAGAAADSGNTELSGRVLASYQKLIDAKHRVADATSQEAQANREAAAAHQIFEAKVRQGVMTMQQQAVAERAAAAAATDLDTRMRRLVQSIDPAAAAQDRFNREISEARTLISTGSISLDQYVAKLRLEQSALDEANAAQARGIKSMGAHSQAMAGASYQVQDFLTQVSMGANPINALAVQGAQLAGQFSSVEGKAGDVARFFMGPWGLAITAGALVLGMLTNGLFDNAEAAKHAEEALKKFQDRQNDIGSFIDATTGRLIEQNKILVQNAILMREKQIDDNKKTIKELSPSAVRIAQKVAGGGLGIELDPDIQGAIVAAKGDVEKLTLSLLKLAKVRPELRPVALEVSTIGGQAIAAQRENAKLAKELRALNGDTTALGASTTATIAKQVALATAMTPLAKARANLALVEDRAAAADKAGGAALKKYRDDLTAATKAVNEAEAAQTAASAAKRDANRDNNHANRLALEAAAIDAQTRNLYALAKAYGESGSAALIAEARVKAESQAIKQRGDVAGAIARQVQLTVAQYTADSARSTASLRDQTKIQQEVNKAVSDGTVPAAQAAEIVRDRIADLPLLAALQAAQAVKDLDGIETVTKALDEQRASRSENQAQAAKSQITSALSTGEDRLAELAEELRLVGETDAVRVRSLATLKATQELSARGVGGDLGVEYIKQQEQIATATHELADAQARYNDALNYTADKWDLIARNVQTAAGGLSDAFGENGRAIGAMASIYANYQATRSRLDLKHAEEVKKAGKDEAALERANARYALATATNRIGAFGDMTAAAKGFFDENSAGYAALQKAEQAFRAIEFALSVRAMAQDTIETVSSIANSGARAASLAVEAVTKAISSLPFPLNLVAGAATAAALVSIGLAVAGSFGGRSSNASASNSGTGSVLGDSSAKSESIKNAIDALKDVDTLTNSYARQMAASLKSIDSQIGGVAAVLIRSGHIDASSGIETGFQRNAVGSFLSKAPFALLGGPIGIALSGVLEKIPVIGDILGGIGNVLGSLFGSRIDVTGSGLFGGPQSVGSIRDGGFDASYFSDIQKTKKFFGIVTGRSTSTEYAPADGALENQFTLILKQFNDAIVAAAGPLGQSTSDIQNRLDSFVVNIGKIDLKDLTGEQIQEKLTAIFGAAADNMANAAFPGFQKFQKVGEGAFETLVRVASTVEAVSGSLDLLGRSAQAMSIAAKLGLADQFESVSALTSAADAYFQAFYTQQEQSAARTAQMGKVFASLGLAMPSTLAAFRQLVEAQDLTTAAGQATYATLLKLAPAFADLQSAMEGAKSAADIASERQDLERQLLELRGDTAALRALELAKVDASNRALQQKIWALQDAQEAAKAADELRKAWMSVGDSIMAEVNRIRGIGGAGNSSFASLQAQFNSATAAARGGDMDAAKSLPGLSQALLNAAALVATSRQELDRVQALTATSLEATNAAIGRLAARSTAATDAALLAASATAQGASAAVNDNEAADLRTTLEALRTEMTAMRTENNAGHAATAGNTGAIKVHLDNVTLESGGDAFSVTAAA